jgi:hypothetical protein
MTTLPPSITAAYPLPVADRLHRGTRGTFRVPLADAARHRGRDADAEPHRDGVDQSDERLGESDGGNRLGTQARHVEDVGHREHRLHHHLEHHRDGQQHHRPADRAFGVVLLGAADRFAEIGPEGQGRHGGGR